MPDLDVSKRSVAAWPLDGAVPSGSKKVVKRRSAGWSVDALAGDENWDVSYKTPAPPDVVYTGIDGEQIDYDVVDMREGEATKKSTWERMKYILLLPAALVAVGLMYGFFKCLCGGKCCGCQALGKGLVNTYVPGTRVHEDGHVSYYQISDKERECFHEMAEAGVAVVKDFTNMDE